MLISVPYLLFSMAPWIRLFGFTISLGAIIQNLGILGLSLRRWVLVRIVCFGELFGNSECFLKSVYLLGGLVTTCFRKMLKWPRFFRISIKFAIGVGRG